ncbi:MAG: pseudouridylate synthase [Bacteroidales bacterium]|nr:pseudouridylate synthase [Bacteroidales bacterium]
MDFEHPSDDFVRSIDVHELLPQQEPFVMIDRLEHFDQKRVVTSTTVNADNLFVENGRWSESGLIENVAQTCAARIGYINRYILSKGIQIGFIGAIRNLAITALPQVGTEITTEVEIQEELFGMILAQAAVRQRDTVLLTTEMKIAIKEE